VARETQQQITLPLALSALLRQWSRCSACAHHNRPLQVRIRLRQHEVSTSIPIDASAATIVVCLSTWTVAPLLAICTSNAIDARSTRWLAAEAGSGSEAFKVNRLGCHALFADRHHALHERPQGRRYKCRTLAALATQSASTASSCFFRRRNEAYESLNGARRVMARTPHALRCARNNATRSARSA